CKGQSCSSCSTKEFCLSKGSRLMYDCCTGSCCGVKTAGVT
uniref:Omega-conotoxin RsXXVIA n=1 Tax=Conus regularis TaxID=1333719 RepID=CXQA_CONRG|nr:RecName: Full=Omega-conotoxin RsXXVIA; AltName: Full=RsXXIVA [Conus regularis]